MRQLPLAYYPNCLGCGAEAVLGIVTVSGSRNLNFGQRSWFRLVGNQ